MAAGVDVGNTGAHDVGRVCKSQIGVQNPHIDDRVVYEGRSAWLTFECAIEK